jgi:integrase
MLRLIRRPRSPHWIIRGSVKGRRIEESTGTADHRLAEEIRAKREAEIHREHIYGRASTATFAEAVVSYLEQGGSKRFVAPILEHFGTTPLVKIDLAAIERGAGKLYPDCSASTRDRQFFTPTVAVLRHAAKRGMCAMPTIERLKKPEPRIRWLTLDEANRLIAACSKHLRPLVIFLLYTGARVGEALWLDWRDIDLVRGHVTFPKTKNGEPRGVPLHPRAVAALANVPHRQGEVFRRPDGMPYERPKDIDDTSGGTRIKTAFAGACERAGIDNFHPHDCRHTWATWHYAANRDLLALQKLGGLKTLSMVTRYAHVNVAELAPLIDRLPGGKSGDAQVAELKTQKE